MDIWNLYNEKNATTTIYLKSVKDSFISKSNISLLYHIISQQLYLTNNNERFLQLQKDIDNNIEIWIQAGNLDKPIDTASFISNDISLQLDYYNNIFIKFYCNKIMKYGQQQFELDNNPYKEVSNINNTKKLFKDFLPSDYENMSVSTYHNTYTLNGNFDRKYNKIPNYRKVLHNRNIDRSFTANDMLKNESRTDLSYKRYNNDELLNNLSYLRKK